MADPRRNDDLDLIVKENETGLNMFKVSATLIRLHVFPTLCTRVFIIFITDLTDRTRKVVFVYLYLSGVNGRGS